MYSGGVTASRAWLWATVLLTAAALVNAVVLAPPAGATPVRALSWLLFTGSSVHVASTAWLFTVPAVRAYAGQHPVRGLWVPLSLILIAGAAGAAAIARRRPARRPPGFCAIYLTSLLFCLPAFVFASPYAAVAGMTIAHGAQYLLLVTLIAGGSADQAPARPSKLSRPVRLALLANISFIARATLSPASHLHTARELARLPLNAD